MDAAVTGDGEEPLRLAGNDDLLEPVVHLVARAQRVEERVLGGNLLGLRAGPDLDPKTTSRRRFM